LPFLLETQKNNKGILYAHMAKANSQWRELEGKNVLVIFNGPHSYISPTWYTQAPAVPTWNYAAIHAYGVVALLDGLETLTVLDKSMAKYEPALLDQRDVVTPEYVERLSSAIIGFKIELTDVQGIQKLGQHKSTQDQYSVYSALSNSTGHDEKALANYMLRRNLGVGIK
jgi:transcriptional regulator